MTFFKIFGNPAGCWLSFLVDVEDERGCFRVSEEERVMLLSTAPISDEAEEEEVELEAEEGEEIELGLEEEPGAAEDVTFAVNETSQQTKTMSWTA